MNIVIFDLFQRPTMIEENVIHREVKAKPFLRWAGGKRWLVKDLEKFLPKSGFKNYHEPFLGGGSIFFHLQPQKAFLSDLNKELIDTYVQVRDNVEKVIFELKKFKNTKECYYKVRGSNYRSEVRKAARFIYLNQTSFNGIYRVNLKGEYNVPYGYRNKNFLEPENLRLVSDLLINCELINCDFTNTTDNIKKGDLVFLDPPYTITHNNNGFFKYNKKLFSEKDQHRLSTFIDDINNIGAYYILTNAAHDKVKEIFKKNNNRTKELRRASLIGGINAKRGKYEELVITNIK